MACDIPLVFVDFETRSRASLKKVGGRAYALHPSTEVICAVLCTVDGATDTRQIWIGSNPPSLKKSFAGVAHNAIGFDRHIWARLKWPEPERWIDTAELSRLAGYPKASLDYLAQTLLGRHKDLEGSKLTRSLSRLSRKTKCWPELTSEILERVIAYCWQDVIDMMDLWQYLAPYEHNDIFGLREVDRIINDRGVYFDTELAEMLIAADAHLGEQALTAAGVSANIIRSNPQLRDAFACLNVDIDNAQRPTIEALLTHSDPQVVTLARARLALSTIAAGKCQAGLARVSADSRLRDIVRYFGAHTGRWAGQGMQLQNLTIGATSDDVKKAEALGDAATPQDVIHAACVTDPDTVIAELPELIEWIDTKTINTLTRACITAPPGYTLTVVDFAGIEARCVAWMAGDHEALEIFRTKGDPYRALASKLFEVPPDQVTKDQRGIGKRAELGCGYGMGALKFEATVRKYGGDWAKIPVTPQQCVDVWRAAHAPIVWFWRNLERAAKDAVKYGQGECWPTRWAATDDGVLCELPSGRCLRYYEMTLREGERGEELLYTGERGHIVGRIHTYGGALTENVVQACSRDIMALALIECEAAGLRPVMHTHDEIVCEVPNNEAKDALALQEIIMRNVPPWAVGMPIDVDGFICKRYRK